MDPNVGTLLPGAAIILLDGVDIGSYIPEGLVAKMKTKNTEALDVIYGDLLPADAWQESQGMDISAKCQYLDFTKLSKMIPGLTLVSGTTYKVTMGKTAGAKITGMSLSVTPRNAALTGIATLTVGRVYISSTEQDFVYGSGKQQFWPVTFKAMADTAAGSDGSWIGSWGDPAASADLVAPTCSAVLPVDGASGVAKAGPIVWTMSKDLNKDTVTAAGVIVAMIDPTGTVCTDVPGSVAVVNAGAATTITFTPTSPMTGSNLHVAMLLPTIKDTKGNALAAFSNANKTSLDFTTAA